MDSATEAALLYHEIHIAPFKDKLDEYFCAHTALTARKEFERVLGNLPVAPRSADEIPLDQVLQKFQHRGGAGTDTSEEQLRQKHLTMLVVASYHTATVPKGASDELPVSVSFVLGLAGTLFSRMAEEAKGGLSAGSHEVLVMFSIFAAVRAAHETKLLLAPHEAQQGQDSSPALNAIAPLCRAMNEDDLAKEEQDDLESYIDPKGEAAEAPDATARASRALWQNVVIWWVKGEYAANPTELTPRGRKGTRLKRLSEFVLNAQRREVVWGLSSYVEEFTKLPELGELVGTPFLQQIVVTILRTLKDAGAPPEASLKSELHALLESEDLANICWAQMHTSDDSGEALVPGQLTEMRQALELDQVDPTRIRYLNAIKSKAEATLKRAVVKGGIDPASLPEATQLQASLVRVLKRKPVRRFIIYEVWIALWIERESSKALTRGAGAYSPATIALEAAELAQQLAVRMTAENVTKVNVTHEGSQLFSKHSVWAPFLGDGNPLLHAARKAAPVQQRGPLLSFVHKTIQEHQVAVAVRSTLEGDITRTLMSNEGIEETLRDLMLTEKREREAGESRAPGKKSPVLLAPGKARPILRLVEALETSPLATLQLAREEQVMDFLVDS